MVSVSTDQRGTPACASSGIYCNTTTVVPPFLVFVVVQFKYFAPPLSLSLSPSDLPWYKVFYRALDKISEFKLAMQVLYIYSNMCTVVGIDDHKSLSQFKTLKQRYYDAFPGIVGL